jgi:hypothetical protein
MARSWRALRGVAAIGSAEQVLAGLHRDGSVGVADRVRVQLEDESRCAVSKAVLGGARVDAEGHPGARGGVAQPVERQVLEAGSYTCAAPGRAEREAFPQRPDPSPDGPDGAAAS